MGTSQFADEWAATQPLRRAAAGSERGSLPACPEAWVTAPWNLNLSCWSRVIIPLIILDYFIDYPFDYPFDYYLRRQRA